MNADRREVVKEIDDTRVLSGIAEAAEIVVDIENKAYARGWAAGVDSTERVEGSMYLIAFGAVGLAGALVGAAAVMLLS